VTWPIDEMPLFVQYMANLIPLRPFFVFLKKLAITGVDPQYYYQDIIHLFGLLLVAYILVYARCRYLQRYKISITPTDPALNQPSQT